MKIGKISTIFLCLLMVATVFAVAVPKNAGAELGIIYILPDGSIVPTDAPISRNGAIYTLTGDIYESIYIQKSWITLDGADYTVDGPGSGFGIYLYQISGVTIENLDIIDFSVGILLERSNSNTINGNTISAGVIGIDLYRCNDNTISGNTVSSLTYGICIYYTSTDNTVSGNTVSSNGIGIELWEINGNTISGNTVSSGTHGLSVVSCYNNEISRNTVSGERYVIYYFTGVGNTIFYNNFNLIKEQLCVVAGTNTWDNGAGEGNFWSDYNGRDINRDGVGDTNLPHQGVDWYPLVNIVYPEELWETAQDVEDYINTLGTLAVLSGGVIHSLLTKLNDALSRLTDNNPKNDDTACNKLLDLLTQIDRLESQGFLTNSEANQLRQMIQNIIALIGCC